MKVAATIRHVTKKPIQKMYGIPNNCGLSLSSLNRKMNEMRVRTRTLIHNKFQVLGFMGFSIEFSKSNKKE
ncbi:hypothetical protein A8938_3076 [Algoriphagus zhangzhouensis]|uniref:Uncharacterized protein n=1 Tax=Algoriphagus zhangzhouensis TaxID=1073327 RepID=A0A1M7ZG55_9BACT|nr:hypothetical protein A8938_3076 [Algoriphagus zhangzhouensis]SHO63844.1 hypothetical protein SAMN04488108_3009 [Algoriphagus zhangzhouensis]